GEVDERAAEDADPQALTGLTFLGLVGLIDPLREDVPAAVERCHHAGVDVRMITGDHPATARAIARRLNISEGAEADVLTGRDIGDGETAESGSAESRIRDAHVFARVEPRQKTTIVGTLQD